MKVRIGDKLVEVDASGKIQATAEEIRHPDGHVDVIILVPCLRIQAKIEEVYYRKRNL